MRKFQQFFNALVTYKKEYGDLIIPYNYVSDDGYKLGNIVKGVRAGRYNLFQDEIIKLNEIDFVWRVHNEIHVITDFKTLLKNLVSYKKQYGNLAVPINYVTTDGIKLGRIVQHIRKGNRKITEKERKYLDHIGFEWSPKRKIRTFKEWYELLLKYKEENGHCDIPYKYVTPDGANLGYWLRNIRYGLIQSTRVQKDLLRSQGITIKD